ncbi:hypothetical protein LJK88_31150 [Paenibacillus sp. P26]|nr:hypothetical protein LJK88_31150 [Paenibacillus sp. P26]
MYSGDRGLRSLTYDRSEGLLRRCGDHYVLFGFIRFTEQKASAFAFYFEFLQ